MPCVVKGDVMPLNNKSSCSTSQIHMVVKDSDLVDVIRSCCSTSQIHMVVKDRIYKQLHSTCCSTARLRMVVNASGTGVLYANG